MSISPIITFKAGLCELDTSVTPPTVKPRQTPGYIYLYSEDDLVHFCWRPRAVSLDEPELDLVMVPMDATFTPYKPTSAENPLNRNRPTNGRIYVLKFSSSSQRFLFWLQSKTQHEHGNPAWFSARDLKLGHIVNGLLQGEDIDVQAEIASLPRTEDHDDDETMEDVEGTDHSPDRYRPGGGGAGPGATGGDVREEGEQAREGGADGGRAVAGSSDPSAVVQNLLRSLQGNNDASHPEPTEKVFTTLNELLPPLSTLPLVESADMNEIDNLLTFLPSTLLMLELGLKIPAAEVSPQEAKDALAYLDLDQKKSILRRVLRSPQFAQSLGSLTVALRDGGLPSISDALQIEVENGGFMRRGGVPLGGGEAVQAFLNGVKRHVEKKTDREDSMETD
ncbi:hypothetical protein LOZ12_005227 [Ophidiomyces ophidiicola]|uniref:Uncharacterized protein n=1 Tax=Ophidiomyces ophidiicola TaxID=1387563 RepID=A0ACB8UZ70_9EURO|nr:uncharacterized protein LOZ57_000191 [Ophidiomyces ophidiicola]KAI1909104.1 hypothetical protein LOZ64_005335 [Ophidiomyces ophidiicola]KAI1937806.1 hypothetical protein LOZ62_005402 [Ophidiomyces ophidiicola]KAI1953850.1 hypothetical protein LOZ57_000191 [Ophidiomyces ophidiicola]KAI1967321.1 hypothetical protein LOZ56_005628 [Ophidiomyces ophidiicola]KAI1976918.1 hypothetical protein LOZ55_003955 [Ophidiomyces ophidiicola]